MNNSGGKFMIVLVLSVAACSGGGDTTEPTTTTGIATTTSSVAQTTTSAAATTTSELVTTTTRYEPEEVAPGERPTSFVAKISFGPDGQSDWFHVDLETGIIQRPVDDDEGLVADPLVSPDGRFRFETVSLDRNPYIPEGDIADLVERYGIQTGRYETLTEAVEAFSADAQLPVLVDATSGQVVRWYNDGLEGEHPWYYCGFWHANCFYSPRGFVGSSYLLLEFGSEDGSNTILSPVDTSDLFQGFELGDPDNVRLHPVEQSNGNVVVAVGRQGYYDDGERIFQAGIEPPFSGAVIDPITGATLASFAIGDGQTEIRALDYDESGTWLLATLDNSIEWQGGGQKDFVTIIDPGGRDFHVSRALW